MQAFGKKISGRTKSKIRAGIQQDTWPLKPGPKKPENGPKSGGLGPFWGFKTSFLCPKVCFYLRIHRFSSIFDEKHRFRAKNGGRRMTTTTATVQEVPGPHPTRPGIKYPAREPPHSDKYTQILSVFAFDVKISFICS